MQTEIPLDFISSRSVKYSHSYGFSNASTGEINLAFFAHAKAPPDQEDKRRTLLSWIFFCLFIKGGGVLEQMYYLWQVGRVGCFRGGTFGIFVWNLRDL